MNALAAEPLRVASLGMGWWSDVLADAINRSGKLTITACYSRSEEKRAAFAAKYGCRAVPSYEAILADKDIEAVINTTPNGVHLETTRAAADAGKHVFLDKPIANTVSDGRRITELCRKAGVVLALGYQRRRENQFRWIKRQIDEGVFGKLVNAEANISRDRLGKIDLGSWRYQAAGMPGGVMLQIGIHYTDVLDYLIGPVKAVSGQFARLVLPGDNPDVASLVLQHENGALSTHHFGNEIDFFGRHDVLDRAAVSPRSDRGIPRSQRHSQGTQRPRHRHSHARFSAGHALRHRERWTWRHRRLSGLRLARGLANSRYVSP